MSRLEEIYNEFECNKKSEILEAMKQYAIECINASLHKASEEALLNVEGLVSTRQQVGVEHTIYGLWGSYIQTTTVSRDSVKSIKNIVLL